MKRSNSKFRTYYASLIRGDMLGELISKFKFTILIVLSVTITIIVWSYSYDQKVAAIQRTESRIKKTRQILIEVETELKRMGRSSELIDKLEDEGVHISYSEEPPAVIYIEP